MAHNSWHPWNEILSIPACVSEGKRRLCHRTLSSTTGLSRIKLLARLVRFAEPIANHSVLASANPLQNFGTTALRKDDPPH